MKLKISQSSPSNNKHTDFVTAVGWNSGNELFSCSDDMSIWRWNVNGDAEGKVCPLDANATDMHWFPVRNTRSVSDVFVVSCTDGSFLLMTKSGRLEKKVDAHRVGAVISIRWNHEGTAIATAGEDGVVKIWSRSGMLRSTLATTDRPVYTVSWGPDSDRVLFSSGKDLIIKPLQPAAKQIKWKAHDGVVLKSDWSCISNLIVSGGEDCKYKVWDSYGRPMFQSKPLDYSITSVAWSGNGELFAVGIYENIRLCDKTGWTYSKNHVESGSIMAISWTTDGTQLAGAGSNGAVVFGQVVERRCEWNNIEATLHEGNKVAVADVLNEATEDLDFPDRVVNMSIGYGFLVITTGSQCWVYSLSNLNTPHIFDIKEVVNFILQSDKFFCMVDNLNGIQVFNYEGRPQGAPKLTGMRPELLNPHTISLGNDYIASVDHTDVKVVRAFDVTSGREVGEPVKHTMDVVFVSLNKYGGVGDRKLILIDRNRDLWVCPIGQAAGSKAPQLVKLGTMVDSAMWNDETDILVAIMDGKFVVWYYPNVVFVDRDLVNDTRTIKDGSQYGTESQFVSFSGDHCCMRCSDGTLLYDCVSPYPTALYELVARSEWERAIQLCRHVKDRTLWACVAAMSIAEKELNTAEVAFAAIDEVDKLRYVLYIKEIPTVEGRNAELALWRRRPEEAEQILVQGGLFYRAIRMHIRLFNWDRALELAVQHRVHVDTVVAFRQRYLEQFERKETNKRFLQYGEGVTVNWPDILQRIQDEKERERTRPGAKPWGE
mmetsp:Transcript_12103/g.27941  ORF Transcript_12103/g.27941 Transcript_12103/m.27941 type:complete len:770 (-) Transcript_12103:166-2475(-)|eukprot:CAMPEP_0114553248 /NCGR_PEP_ID=MMETSP0114-20121206/7551_1 /TAXON_ID=31324 /ORGANISM="Goniomonas sp, Strain m" /LENGTH=769 /DNA_ID=CAMNT_0001738167 /DNA_START=62 /DNA_END=2371 /DNA_ORIENTATION=+